MSVALLILCDLLQNRQTRYLAPRRSDLRNVNGIVAYTLRLSTLGKTGLTSSTCKMYKYDSGPLPHTGNVQREGGVELNSTCYRHGTQQGRNSCFFMLSMDNTTRNSRWKIPEMGKTSWHCSRKLNITYTGTSIPNSRGTIRHGLHHHLHYSLSTGLFIKVIGMFV